MLHVGKMQPVSSGDPGPSWRNHLGHNAGAIWSVNGCHAGVKNIAGLWCAWEGEGASAEVTS